MTTSTYTAKRTSTPAPRITVYCDGVEVGSIGGNRAARARVVIVGQQQTRPSRVDPTITITPKLEIMARKDDDGSAAQEAHRLATATTIRSRGYDIPVDPYAFAVAVEVQD